MADLLERITDLLNWTTLGPAAFADEIGVSRPIVSHVLTGRNKASLEVVQKILSRYKEVSPLWLLSGEGEMFIGQTNQPPPERKIPLTTKEQLNVEPNGATQPKVSGPSKDNGLHLDLPVDAFDEKRLVKVILLYSDGSFSGFDPS